jgi:hypothetical protein
MHLGLDIICF